jgi:hypothetical protein
MARHSRQCTTRQPQGKERIKQSSGQTLGYSPALWPRSTLHVNLVDAGKLKLAAAQANLTWTAPAMVCIIGGLVRMRRWIAIRASNPHDPTLVLLRLRSDCTMAMAWRDEEV